ncbi:polymorphic toxin-type HINT domain-containing protein, partial [Ursidibacter sp. B-7004-1]
GVAAGLSSATTGGNSLAIASSVGDGMGIAENAVENNALTNKYSYELLDDKEKALFDKLKANSVKDVDQFEVAFNQAKTQEERDQIIAEYKEAVAAANQIIANLYKQGIFTDEDYSLFISSYSQKMLEGAKQGQIENNGKSQLSFWGTLSESDPYLFYGTEWFVGNQLNNEQLKSVRNQYWDKQVEKGVITPAERELILAKDNAYTAYLPIARPDEVKNFVKALLSDDISTLQLLTKGHIATPKKSTVEKQKITCTTACFVAGTLVETARGFIPIEQIGFGDLIWSREEFGNHYAYKPVTATKATDNQQLVEVIVENEQGQQETYLTTTEHPFYVEGIGWLKSTLLSSEMKLLDRNGSASLKVISQNELDRYATVYNIMVDDHHTYHIGELGVWVHNDKCCDIGNIKIGQEHPQTGNKVLDIKESISATEIIIESTKPSTKGMLVKKHYYENPGHHDPRGGNQSTYKPEKSVLPNNHIELWQNSVETKDGNRWAVEIIKGKPIYHRFEPNPNTGVYHWNGSTNGKTASGIKRQLPMNLVPNEIQGK